jgi:transcriptional regulator with XRE-family HTH domain
MSRLGTEINRLRIEKKLTQKQLGKLIGVSEGVINEIETGKRIVTGDLTVRIWKALGKQDDSYDLYAPLEKREEETTVKKVVNTAPEPIQQVWTDALSGVLRTIPVYGYKMDKVLFSKQLPVINNKVEGYPKDKVYYLQIEDNDMMGFRIIKGDIALAYEVQSIEKDGIYFIEYKGVRVIRQVKRLDKDQLLLVSNREGLMTEMVSIKNIKLLGGLKKLEIQL